MKIEKIKQIGKIRLIVRIGQICLIGIICLIGQIGQIKIAHAAIISKAPNNLGLVGAWNFDEGTGNKVGDSSGNGFTGTMVGGGSWSTGKHGKAFIFSGSNYADLGLRALGPKLNGATSITMSAWFNPTSYPSGTNRNRVIGFYHGGNTAGLLGLNSSTGNIEVGGRGSNADSFLSATTTVAQLNTWTHVVGILNFTADTIQIYVNGSLATTSSANFTSNTYVDSLPILNDAIGGYSSGETFTGKIDDVRIYTRQLTATQVSDLYKSGQVTRKTVSNQGLVGYWAMNEGRGNIVGDSSGFGDSGTLTNFGLTGSTSNWFPGKHGVALDFDGINDQVNFGAPSTLDFNGQSSITISAWAKLTDANQPWPVIIAKQAGGGGQYNLQFGEFTDRTPTLYLNVASWGNKVKAASALLVNRWYYIVATYDGTTAKIYIDGVLSNSAALSGSFSGNSSDSVFIGQANNVFMKGQIDEVRVYNRALSATEVQTLYKQNETKINSSQNSRITNGLVGYWTFNGQDYNPASTTAEVLDVSGNGNNADAVNGPVLGIGKVGQGVSFNGVTDYVNLGKNINPASNSFTWAFWEKSNKDTCGETFWDFVNNRQTSGAFTGVLITQDYNAANGKIRVQLNDTTSHEFNAFGTQDISNGNWRHIVVVVDRTNNLLTTYVDRTQDGSTSIATVTGSLSSNQDLLLARDAAYGGCGNKFIGSMDEFRAYNRALSATEAKQLYNMGK